MSDPQPPDGVVPPQLRAQRAMQRIRMLLAHRHALSGGDPRDPLPQVNGSLLSMTVQQSALLGLCLERGVFTAAEYETRLAEAFEQTLESLETPKGARGN